LRPRKDGLFRRAHSPRMPRRSTASLLRLPLTELLAALPPRAVKPLGLSACLGCAMAPFETVGEAVRIMGCDAQRVSRALEAALRKAGRR